MKLHEEFTWGWIIFVAMLPPLAFIAYLYVFHLGDHPMNALTFLLIAGLIVVMFVLFYGLKTVVSNEMIVVSFGIGLIRKRIALRDVKSVREVETPWYYGWGIRFIPGGMLYNISGTKGIELAFHDRKSIFRIGSADPHKLRLAIEQAMSNLPIKS